MQITICDICGTNKNVRKVWLPYDRQAPPLVLVKMWGRPMTYVVSVISKL